MNQSNPTIYGKNKSGKLQQWSVFTDGSLVIVEHGLIGGKLQQRSYESEAKNIGKANETTPEQQAEVEALAKYVKQLKSGYFLTKEEALSSVNINPMKLEDYKEFGSRVKYPWYGQYKLNGLRFKVGTNLKALSKAGEDYKIPAHWENELELIINHFKISTDGEVYDRPIKDGGLSLQKINSSFKKPNENTHKLKYHIYNVAEEGIEFNARLRILDEVAKFIEDNDIKNVVVVPTVLLNSEKEAEIFNLRAVEEGYEGTVEHDPVGLYEHGVRSKSSLKRKPRQEVEVKCKSVVKDRNGDGVITGELQSGVLVDFLMRKDADDNVNYRKHENAIKLIETFVTVEYEELSDAGVPTKPVGIKLREMIEGTWEPKE